MNRFAALRSILPAAVLLFVPLTGGDANAKPPFSGAKCVSKSGTQTNMGSDGSECSAEADGKNGSKAIAKASGNGADAQSSVTLGGRGKSTALDGSTADTEADGPSMAVSNATGVGSFADSNTSNNGIGISTASSGGDSGANARSNCKSTATASNNGTSINGCFRPGSVSETTADGGTAGTSSEGNNCRTKATSTGDGSDAEATCINKNTKVIAVATGGGIAMGFDFQAPVCTPNGGTAMVKSPMGNCP
jgi:hypothetical protein